MEANAWLTTAACGGCKLGEIVQYEVSLGEMEDFYIKYYNEEAGSIMYVVPCIIICIGLPLTILAIYALFSEVQNDHVAPIYVINLLVTDLIQLCCLTYELVQPKERTIFIIIYRIYSYCLVASVCFMMCIALERYLVIACPLWYRFRRTIKISVLAPCAKDFHVNMKMAASMDSLDLVSPYLFKYKKRNFPVTDQVLPADLDAPTDLFLITYSKSGEEKIDSRFDG
ncbi:hypothetical protein ABVT39_016649 [Epinephelus coioides]